MTMKSQKWTKREALGSNYTFKDGLEENYTVCSNKCILKSLDSSQTTLIYILLGQIVY